MSSYRDPWYIHAALYLVIAVLTVILIKVAIIDPKTIVQQEKYYKEESRLRMKNIKEAEILWQRKKSSFTDKLDELVNFIKTDPYVDSIMNAFDSLSRRPANPFVPLKHGQFTPDSLLRTPKSHQAYILQIDTTVSVDTVVNRRGKIIRIDTTKVIGNRYYLEDPDGYGSIGSLENDAKKNTASWE